MTTSSPVGVLAVLQGAPGGIGRVELLLDHAWRALAQSGSVQATTVRKGVPPQYLARVESSLEWTTNGKRASFVIQCLQRFLLEKPSLVVIGHINLSPIGLLMKYLRPETKLAILIYGTDAWYPLPAIRRWAAMRADAIWSISEYTRDRFISAANLPRDKVQLLSLSLPPEQRDKLISNGQAATNNGTRLLTVSRLDPGDQAKGIEHILRALPSVLKNSPTVKYTIVGDGEDRARLKRQAEDLKLGHAVTFRGPLSDDDLTLAYKECDLFVLPSNQEGFGLVALEAMAARKPVIGAMGGATPEVVLHERTGLLVPYGDIDGLSEAMTRLISDPSLRADLGKRGHQRASERFGFERFVGRLSFLIHSLAPRSAVIQGDTVRPDV